MLLKRRTKTQHADLLLGCAAGVRATGPSWTPLGCFPRPTLQPTQRRPLQPARSRPSMPMGTPMGPQMGMLMELAVDLKRHLQALRIWAHRSMGRPTGTRKEVQMGTQMASIQGRCARLLLHVDAAQCQGCAHLNPQRRLIDERSHAAHRAGSQWPCVLYTATPSKPGATTPDPCSRRPCADGDLPAGLPQHRQALRLRGSC